MKEDKKSLGNFIGKWRTSGNVLATGTNPEKILTGIDSYEWLMDESILLHRVDVLMGNIAVKSIEIIGPQEDAYFMHSYDEKGEAGTMKATYLNDNWEFEGKTERFKGNFSEDNTEFSGLWEQYKEGNWVPWMKLKLKRF